MTVEFLWETLLLGAERGVEKNTSQWYILDTFTFIFERHFLDIELLAVIFVSTLKRALHSYLASISLILILLKGGRCPYLLHPLLPHGCY